MRLLELSDVLVGYFDLALLILFVLFLVVLLLVGFGLSTGTRLLLSDVTFVCKHNYTDIGAAVLFDFFEPAVYIVETLLICEVEDDENAVRSLVIRLRNCPIPLLACCVPYLQPHRTLVYL